MLYVDSYEMYEEKATWELRKNITCHSEQIQKAAPHKTALVGPPTFYLTNHPSKTSKTCWAEEVEQTHKQHSLMDSYTWVHQQELTYISFMWTLVAV